MGKVSFSKSQEPWIRGGPLLEVSFLIEVRTSRQDFITQILTDLGKISLRVEVVPTNVELATVKEEFARGYPLDEKDAESVNVHSVSIPVYVHFKEHRKAYIRIQQISETLANISFDFFGSAHDAREWRQKGVKETDLPTFVDLLEKLFDVFEFPVGTIGLEYDSKDLFPIDVGWPNSGYDLRNLDMTRLTNIDATHFICILLNKRLPYPRMDQKAKETHKYLLLGWKGLWH